MKYKSGKAQNITMALTKIGGSIANVCSNNKFTE
jgi:hypothetical protein